MVVDEEKEIQGSPESEFSDVNLCLWYVESASFYSLLAEIQIRHLFSDILR